MLHALWPQELFDWTYNTRVPKRDDREPPLVMRRASKISRGWLVAANTASSDDTSIASTVCCTTPENAPLAFTLTAFRRPNQKVKPNTRYCVPSRARRGVGDGRVDDFEFHVINAHQSASVEQRADGHTNSIDRNVEYHGVKQPPRGTSNRTAVADHIVEAKCGRRSINPHPQTGTTTGDRIDAHITGQSHASSAVGDGGHALADAGQ